MCRKRGWPRSAADKRGGENRRRSGRRRLCGAGSSKDALTAWLAS
ncbi:hypothetical protein ATSB10_12450 [Dyella thiooxydans]|uniref:Uncharacterized protein n=1 Tax=Dyella thiooxydans TaxID=445710 RepID=A0A169GR72_9GAMM|nr:hypothetical protein ATSB10_12450 [Dyella thiooxydans]